MFHDLERFLQHSLKGLKKLENKNQMVREYKQMVKDFKVENERKDEELLNSLRKIESLKTEVQSYQLKDYNHIIKMKDQEIQSLTEKYQHLSIELLNLKNKNQKESMRICEMQSKNSLQGYGMDITQSDMSSMIKIKHQAHLGSLILHKGGLDSKRHLDFAEQSTTRINRI